MKATFEELPRLYRFEPDLNLTRDAEPRLRQSARIGVVRWRDMPAGERRAANRPDTFEHWDGRVSKILAAIAAVAA